ncbi:hypothetical protein RoPhRER2_gp25 [Rhodococcus phage RER2]|uniref:Uncharacterized protein n=3 Tax=Rerduovirus TaxID=1982375 RepID=G9FHS5_9CAUD|nr:hypothetical protein RoPhRER2_gp25 [Rhodococcus phage RER2]YP_009834073.1 hypothetical protein HWB24_gp39 [Rhodococcus phage Hiro]YP_010060245.1 hypothetical protein KIJ60_gp37 [Rhodococcus phage PhailMary]AOT23602.1 hypothetical protein SEA_HARLEQUIN_33 [Rhodococcus phage Harlequin]AOZ62789.1 hypothetical protein SEA_YOGI_33 [Rhodococcus phage Yogi]AQP30960.1 hypothetical protein SEA_BOBBYDAZZLER_33 [Rhodococcus phage BobbyDazzler]ASJ78836.1 hypothetical protein SEA_JESTER_33 [Rhodococcus
MSQDHIEQLQQVLDGADELRGAVLSQNAFGFLDLVAEDETTLARFFREGVGELLTFAYAAIPDLVQEINELREENERLEIERDDLAAKEYDHEAALERALAERSMR